MKPTYAEQLKDPRWQKKRLEVLERDAFTCQHCFDSETELHVHHLAYGKSIWDVESSALITLCKNCHKGVEDVKKTVARLAAFGPYLQSLAELCSLLEGGHYEIQTILRSLTLEPNTGKELELAARPPIERFIASQS